MASFTKAVRMEATEKLAIQGLTHAKIAEKVGVSVPTIERYMAQRRKVLFKKLSDRQAIAFDFLVRKSMEDFEQLGNLIDQAEEFSLVVTDAYGKRVQIARNLARFMGIESTVKIQNIQNNLHLTKNENQVSLNGPVQIIVEGNGGQFNPEHGQDQIRMDSPSADEISSASS